MRSIRGSISSATSIARPLIGQRQIELARSAADARRAWRDRQGTTRSLRLTYYALKPDVDRDRAVAELEPTPREALIAFAGAAPDPDRKRQKRRGAFSVDANLLHALVEGQGAGGIPPRKLPNYVYSRTLDPRAPDAAAYICPRF